jgi:gluconolactonase
VALGLIRGLFAASRRQFAPALHVPNVGASVLIASIERAFPLGEGRLRRICATGREVRSGLGVMEDVMRVHMDRAAAMRRHGWAVWFAPVVALLGCPSGAMDLDNEMIGMSGGSGASGTGGAAASAGQAGSKPVAGAGPGGANAGDSGKPGGGGAVGSGGSTPAGSGGMGGSMAVGEDGGGGSLDTGDAGGPEPVSYPALDAAQIGEPIMLSNDFTLAESPVWDPCGHQMLFTDVTASVIHTLSPSGQVGMFASNTGNANGIAYDIDGSLILAQMGGSPGHIARRDKAGKITVLEPAGGPRLHTPDDVIVRSDGAIYFSDGDFYPIGNLLGAASILPVYMYKPGASALVNAAALSGPNGIEFSPDEKTLYVDAFGGGSVDTFSVAADGTLTPGAPVATGLDSPDSLCLDAAGNLYVGVKTGLWVARPDGTGIKLLAATNTRGTTSCGFGGDDGKTLYITAWTSIWKVENMPIPGQDWLVNQTRVKCD